MMMSSIAKLSILEATAIGPGVSAEQALQWTSDIARLADELNYYRLWVVEHHNAPDIGCSTPAVLMAHLADVTQHLRIGAGGVMLPNHSPFVVAEQFRMLQGLYPQRIDLGIGRARSGDPVMNRALQRHHIEDYDFESELEDLCHFLKHDFPAEHPFEKLKISLDVKSPPVYLLGSGSNSARFAAKRGFPFAFAHHLNPKSSRQSLAVYTNEFHGSSHQKQPCSILTTAVVCAETIEEAQHNAMKAAIIRLRRAAVQKSSLDVSDEAILFPQWTEAERSMAEKELSGGWIIIGDPDKVRHELLELQQSTHADELMLTTIEYDGPSRMRTLKLIGNIFNDQLKVGYGHA